MTINRILIVDDEEMMRSLLERCLERARPFCQVTTVASGPEALLQLQRQPYDLIIVDYQMPGMHGLDLARLIRREFPEIALMLITGSPSRAASQALDQGLFDGYLEKPFRLDQFLAAVDQIENSPTKVSTLPGAILS